MLDKNGRLFVRWRERGDTRALAALFDRTAPELMALAAHLARNPQAAEDLVQATFLAALEGAPRYDRGRPLLPWLVGILVREVRRARRAGARGLDPERLVQAQPEDPAQSAQRAEFSEALSAALAALSSTDRDVLVPYLRDGQCPAEIAGARGLAPGTVRVRIHRGLARLRRALPPSAALAGAALLDGSRGLDAVRVEVLGSRAASSSRALAQVSAGSSLPLVLAGGVALVAGLATLRLALPDADVAALEALGAGAATPASAPQGRDLTAVDRAPQRQPGSPLVGGSSAAPRRAQVAAAAPSREPDAALEPAQRVVVGRVVVPPGYSAADAFVALCPEGSPGLPDPARGRSVFCAADGSFRIAASEPAWLVAAAAGLRPLTRGVAPGAEELDAGPLWLEQGASIEGTVLDRGQPAPGELRLDLEPQAALVLERTPLPLAWCGDRFEHARASCALEADGRFRICGLRPGAYHARPTQRIDPARSLIFRLEDRIPIQAPASGLVLENPLQAWVVAVRAEGRPLADAVVEWTTPEHWKLCAGGTDADGISGLWNASPSLQLCVSHPGFTPVERSVLAEHLDPESPLVVELERDGVPGRVRLELTGPGAADARPLRVVFERRDEGWSRSVTLERGDELEIAGLPAGPLRARASLPARGTTLADQGYARLSAEVALDVLAGGVSPLPLQVSLGGRLRLEASGEPAGRSAAQVLIVGRDGSPLQRDFLRDGASETLVRSARLDRAASWLCDPTLPPGAYRLRRPGAEELDFQITAGQTTTLPISLAGNPIHPTLRVKLQHP